MVMGESLIGMYGKEYLQYDLFIDKEYLFIIYFVYLAGICTSFGLSVLSYFRLMSRHQIQMDLPYEKEVKKRHGS